MALLIAPATAAFDNLSPAGSTRVQSSATVLTLTYLPEGGKGQHQLKISGSFDGSGRALALEQAVLTLPDAQTLTLSFPFALSGFSVDLTATSLRVDRVLEQLLAGDDLLTLGNGADAVNAGAGDDLVNGGGGNDRLRGGAGDDALQGGSGIDTSLYSDGRAGYELRQTATGFTVTDRSGAEGTDTLTGVERVRFADVGVALDLSGHAGVVARLLGAVFGPKSVGNTEYAGIGLRLLDEGMTPTDLAALAVDAAGRRTPVDIVNLLWTQVVGSPPTPAQAQPYVDMLVGGMPVGTLALFAADTDLNQANIDLAGLAKTGLEYSGY